MMTTPMSRALCFSLLGCATTMSGCSKDEPPAPRPASTTAPAAVSAVPPPALTAAPAAGQRRFELTSGASTFLIDAPLEKIKGRSTKVRGTIDVDPADLRSARGQIELDLQDLQTETFGDKAKDGSQTDHARNWLEIGSDVEAKRRDENRWVRFTIKALDEASPTKLAVAEAKNGQRSVAVRATGDLWLHGVTSPKKVNVVVTFDGPAEAPTALRLVTAQPFTVSLKEHDVKPRDLTGKFLSGALEKIGQKIDDNVQVSLDLTAKAR
jgi:polyisoprenoid-binding protein YceI